MFFFAVAFSLRVIIVLVSIGCQQYSITILAMLHLQFLITEC